MGAHSDSVDDDDHVCDYGNGYENGCNAVLENCSDVDTDNDHSCDVCGKANVSSHNHVENTAWATSATCNSAETHTYVCNCGDDYEETIGSALEHDVTGVQAIERQINGCEYVLVYVCQRTDCGDEVTGETVYHHDYVASISKAATCTTAGCKTFRCSACGDTSKTPEVIPADATGHSWTVGTVENGKRTDTCSVCSTTKTVIVSDGNSASSNASDLADADLQLKVDDNTSANIQLGQGVADAIGDKDVTISAGVIDENTLKDMGVSDKQLDQIGTNTVYDFNMKDGNGTPITNFGEDNYVTITLPYVLGADEDVDSIAVWFISDTCQVEDCDKGEGCVDAHKLVSIEATYNNGFVTFKTNHFSIYTVTRLTPAERCALYGHSWVDQVVEGNCTKDGYTLSVCVRCHEKYIDPDSIQRADGHDYTTTTQDATCTEDGYVLYDCDDCDYSYKTKISATGHEWSVEDFKDATCMADGYTKYGCDNCTEEYTIVHAKVAHEYTNTVVDATCTADGYTLHDCDNCDYSYTDAYVTALGHAYESTTWAWASDYSTATLTFVCEHDEEHVMVLNATVTKTVVNGTCSNFVRTTYTATLSYGETNCADEKIVEIGTPDHNYSSEWSADENEHWHECVCGAKNDVSEHIFENATVTKAPTCDKAGESTSYCVCGAEKVIEVPATGEHNYVDGTCTGCGKEYVDAYYVNLVNSWKNINGFAIKLENLSYEVKQINPDLLDALKVIGSVKQIDIAELAIYMENGELQGAAIGEIVIFNGPISNANAVYKFKAVIHDGYVYIKVEHGKDTANKAMNIKMSVDAMMDSMLAEMDIEGEMIYVLDFFKDTLLPAVDTLIELNSEDANAILEDLFNMIFTFEQQADGSYVATLDYAKLYALNENLATKSVAEVIDLYFGEGSFDSIVAFVNEILDLEISKIPAYLDEKGLNSAELFAKINELAAQTGAPDGYDFAEFLNSEEFAGVTLGMLIFDVEDRSYVESVNEVVSGLRNTTLYAMFAPEAVDDVKNSVKSVLDMIADRVSIGFKTDAEGMLTAININVDEFTYSDDETEVFLNFDLEIVINGKIDVTWSDIIESIEAELVLPEEDMLDDGIQSDYDNGWGGYVEYKGQKYEYHEGVRIYARKTLYDKLAYVIFQPDCNGWMGYEACYAEEVYEFMLATITVDGKTVMLLIDEYSGEVVELIEAETGITVIYADGTEKTIDMSSFNEMTDPAAIYAAMYFEIFEDPTGYVEAFGDYLYYYYNAETKEYSTETHHEYEYDYEFDGDSCEDGCTVITGCKNCDYYDEHTRYSCDIECGVEIDLSEHTSCGGTIIVDQCTICGKIEYVQDVNISCNMGDGTETELKDANGNVIGYEYTSTCANCGLVFVEKEWIEALSSCVSTEYQGMYIYKGEICILTYVDERTRMEHDYEYIYEMKGDSCEDGYKCIETCKVCGESHSWHSSGHRYDGCELDMSEYGCEGVIRCDKCRVCDKILNVYGMDLGCKAEDEEPETFIDENGITHTVTDATCPDCGLRFVIEVWTVQKSVCVTEQYRKIQIYQGETLILDSMTTTGAVRHDYDETYEMLGSSCEDGYYVIRTCSICGESERWHSNGHRYDYREVDLGEFGLCGGYIEEEYCPVCNTILYSYYREKCCWEYVEETADGYEKYECCDCHAVKLVYFAETEKDANCQLTRTEVRIYIVKDEEVYRYENSSTYEEHEYQYKYTLNGESCEDGYTLITTCADCNIRWTEEHYDHREFEEVRIELDEHGACYGEYVFYTCACGKYRGVRMDSCSDDWTSNEYFDEKLGYTVFVETRSCSKCGLRYTRSYYAVEDPATCTATYYYSVVLNIGETLVAEKEYTRVEDCHYMKATGTLLNGAGSSCEDGVRITYQCIRCDYSYSNECYWHEMMEKEIIDLSEFGNVCGGYAIFSECTCGERGEMSLDHSLCEWGSEYCELWIENAITEEQYTIDGRHYIWNDSYIYICAVTDPAERACGDKIRYAYYWLKDPDSCVAYRYQTWQFGYDAETGTCEREVTFRTGESMIYHDYEDTSATNHKRFDCVDCKSYYDEQWIYEDDQLVKHTKQISNTLDNGYDKFYEYIEEYAFDEADGSYYTSRECWKYTHADGTESWSENTISKYDGPFGDDGREVTKVSCDRDGTRHEETYAYVINKGIEYTIYRLTTEGDYWCRYDYEYDLVDGCVKTTIYTDCNEEKWTEKEDYCFFWKHETTKAPTCTQSGERCDVCVICGAHTDSYEVEPTDHNWVEVSKGWYCCFSCGLENANGVSGDIIMEDLTEIYGNDENYVVGYYIRNNVKFTYYVCVVLADGTEDIVEIEFTTIDGLRAYVFSKAVVEAYAESKGYTDYDVKFVFVPIGSDSSFDYAVTFTETIDVDTVIDDVSFIDYVPEGEWVGYTIIPAQTGAWTFTSASYFDTYAELYDSDGNLIINDDDSGTQNNFYISINLEAGQSYTIKVKWLDSAKAGTMPLLFTFEG